LFKSTYARDSELIVGQSRVRPVRQKTWFDNIRGSLAQPLFAIALRRNAPGTIDFGFIDRKKIVGDIHWVPVRSASEHWDLQLTGITVDFDFKPGIIDAFTDSGTSIWLMPKDFVNFYYSKVKGASFDTIWTFPCNSGLPDISVHIAGKNITIPGINMNYDEVSRGVCVGGLQPVRDSRRAILGAVFMKHLYVIHEHAVGGEPRLGLAHSQRP